MGKSKNKKTHENAEIADSMGQAAARLDCDVALLRAAKRAGCPAFKPGARVDIAALREWLTKNKKDLPIAKLGEKTSLEIRRLQNIVERQEFDLERDRGGFFPRAEVLAVCQDACNRSDAILRQIPQLANQLVGRPIDDIHKLLSSEIARVREELRKMLG